MSALTEVAAPGTDLPRRRARGRGDGLGPWWLVAAVLPVAFPVSYTHLTLPTM